MLRRRVFFVLLLTVLVLLPAQAQAIQAHSSLVGISQTTTVTLPVVINEVMPKPGVQGAAWVELFVGEQEFSVYLPAIAHTSGTEVQTATLPSGQHPLVTTLNLAGWQISNEQGQVYQIPPQVSNVPNNTYILVYFDGQGPAANDYNPNDGQIVLHTPAGMLDIFPDTAGQVALYEAGSRSPQSIVDFVAWGGFNASTAANAVAAGIWPQGHAVSFENGFGDISEADILESDESIARYPGAVGRGALLWANYPTGSATPGAANTLAPVTFITPQNGARVDTATLSLSWREAAGASAYHFQLDNGTSFDTPLIDVITPHTFFKPNPLLSPGTYYWRVNPLQNGNHTAWTKLFQIEVVNLGVQAASVTAEKVLGIGRVRQNKDSYLLGLDGAPEGDPTTNTPEDAWDSPAPCTVPPCADYTKYTHGRQYCVRASIRMMASWYNGGNVLSMDRISYHILEEWSGNTRPGTNDGIPDNDLGYDRGMYYPDEEDEGISWALNTTINSPGGKPSFANIKSWIDANRPIMFRRPGHMMVIDGYREIDGDQYIHVLDPDQPPALQRWQDYSTQTIDGYWVGPSSGMGRSDEASVSTDSDGDGIMDFDEVNRFNLNAYDSDTDDDWVPDKKDMREYVFDAAGNYSKRNSDLDGDGLRKERDADNDGDGSPDGCEDTNYNGIYEAGAGETDNFSAASHQACTPLFNILYPLKTEPENAGDPAAPDKILVQVSTAVPAGWSLTLTAGDFDVFIGGDPALVLSVYPSADTYFLVVKPPPQAAAAYYDLKVNLSGTATDGEPNAVYYLEKAPNDEVIVLDRSGSMLSDDKIAAAKNAASAFVDFLNDGDAIGVTSFASSASTNYPLTEITAASVRSDAINAIDSLSASGTTALGQGVQQGYAELTSSGNSDHDWSLVLLSDGWENVAPYWADVESSITDAVVHTVALGEDADKALLQSIAGAKHGQYFYV
ncbi:MAG: VWA domain-containing protein, partial [Chloroflexi bacterium]|nr:VWA domain-containing protein [Chloroflexota bacterium]